MADESPATNENYYNDTVNPMFNQNTDNENGSCTEVNLCSNSKSGTRLEHAERGKLSPPRPISEIKLNSNGLIHHSLKNRKTDDFRTALADDFHNSDNSFPIKNVVNLDESDTISNSTSQPISEGDSEQSEVIEAEQKTSVNDSDPESSIVVVLPKMEDELVTKDENTLNIAEKTFTPPQPIADIQVKEKKKYLRKHYSTEKLQEALQKCREGLSIRECSKQYGIPKSTLWDKLSCRTPPAVLKPGRSNKVSQDVEIRLADWIFHMNQHGFKISDRHVLNAAKFFQHITDKSDSKATSNPGKSWYKGYIERFPVAAYNQGCGLRKIEYSLDKMNEWYNETHNKSFPALSGTVEIVPPPLSNPPPEKHEQSTIDQVQSVLQHIEEIVGHSRVETFKQWKESGDITRDDSMFTAWFTLAIDLDRRIHVNKPKRKRKAEQPRLNGNYYMDQNSTKMCNGNQAHKKIIAESKMECRIASVSSGMIDLNATTGYLPPNSQTIKTESYNIDNEEQVIVEERSPPPIENSVKLLKPHPRKTMMLNFTPMK